MKLIEKLCKEAWDRHVNKREHFPVYEAFFRDGFEAGFRKARSRRSPNFPGCTWATDSRQLSEASLMLPAPAFHSRRVVAQPDRSSASRTSV